MIILIEGTGQQEALTTIPPSKLRNQKNMDPCQESNRILKASQQIDPAILKAPSNSISKLYKRTNSSLFTAGCTSVLEKAMKPKAVAVEPARSGG